MSYLEDKASQAADKAAEKADARLNVLLEKFAEAQIKVMEAAAKSSLSGEQLEAILTRVGATSATSMQKALRPENEIPPMISAFNPEGDRDHAKRGLDRKTFLNGHPEHQGEQATGPYPAEMLLQAEIDAYNELGRFVALEQNRGLVEARNGLYRADLRMRGTELHVTVPVANLDTRLNLPPTLIMLCHELRTGENMTDLNGLLAEVAALRAQVAALQGSQPPLPPARAQTKPTITVPAGPLVADLVGALEVTPTTQLAGE